MRILITMIIILVLIVGAGYWTNNALQKATNGLVKQIDIVITEIRSGDKQAAITANKQLEDKWKKEAKWWPIFLDHQEIDNIEFCMARTKEYVKNGNNPLSLGQLSELRLMIEHIPEKEAVTLENIL
ncbi:MAG: DUF4363 family protein [Syntrophomonadaceae bacterium]